ncbi:MAG: hypothetical protein ACI9MR_000613 [Myxococcota bacterium]|jgi:hypothetical protein
MANDGWRAVLTEAGATPDLEGDRVRWTGKYGGFQLVCEARYGVEDSGIVSCMLMGEFPLIALPRRLALDGCNAIRTGDAALDSKVAIYSPNSLLLFGSDVVCAGLLEFVGDDGGAVTRTSVHLPETTCARLTTGDEVRASVNNLVGFAQLLSARAHHSYSESLREVMTSHMAQPSERTERIVGEVRRNLRDREASMAAIEHLDLRQLRTLLGDGAPKTLRVIREGERPSIDVSARVWLITLAEASEDAVDGHIAALQRRFSPQRAPAPDNLYKAACLLVEQAPTLPFVRALLLLNVAIGWSGKHYVGTEQLVSQAISPEQRSEAPLLTTALSRFYRAALGDRGGALGRMSVPGILRRLGEHTAGDLASQRRNLRDPKVAAAAWMATLASDAPLETLSRSDLDGASASIRRALLAHAITLTERDTTPAVVAALLSLDRIVFATGASGGLEMIVESSLVLPPSLATPWLIKMAEDAPLQACYGLEKWGDRRALGVLDERFSGFFVDGAIKAAAKKAAAAIRERDHGHGGLSLAADAGKLSVAGESGGLSVDE